MGEPGIGKSRLLGERDVTDQTSAIVTDKVERYLGDLSPEGVRRLPSGLLGVQHGSTAVFIGVGPMPSGFTSVQIFAMVLRHVIPTDDLCRYLVRNATRHAFGRFELARSDVPDTIDIVYRHTLLGDYLDREEFNLAISEVAQAADEFDNEMQAQFGGDIFFQ